MHKKRVIGFAGAGGTGKTVTLNELAKQFDKKKIKYIIHPSVVRDYYKIQGIASESDLHKQTEPERIKFQLELAQYFMTRLEMALEEHKDAYIICDRTIFDHLAYWLFSGINDIKLADYKQYLSLIERYKKNLKIAVYFPYPASFSKDVDPDAFRWAPPSKNLIIDGLIYKHLKKHTTLGTLREVHEEDTVEDRAEAIMRFVIK